MAFSPPSSISGRLSAADLKHPPAAPSASAEAEREQAELPKRPVWRELLRWLWWWTMLACILACAVRGGGGAFIYQRF